MAEEKLRYIIEVDAKTGELSLVNKELEETSKTSKKVEDSFLGLGKQAQDLLKTFGLYMGAREILDFFKSSIAEAEQENETFRRLGFQLETLGISFSNSRPIIESWGKQIQANTRFTDSEAYASLEKFTKATNSLTAAQQAAKLAMDISAQTGKDLANVQEILFHLMTGNERAVREARNEFGRLVSINDTNGQVLQKLGEKFKDAAEKEESFTKTTKQLKGAFEDLKKEVGEKTIPVLDELLKRFVMSSEVQNIDDYIEALKAAGHPIEEELVMIQQEYRRMQTVIDEFKSKNKPEPAKMTLIDPTDPVYQEYLDKRLQQLQEFEEARRKIYEEAGQIEVDIAQDVSNSKMKTMEDERKFARKIYVEMAQEFSKAAADIILDSKNLDEAVTGMFRNIERSIVEAITQMLVFRSIASAFNLTSFGGLSPWGILGASGSPSMPRISMAPPSPLSQNPSSVRAAAAQLRTIQSLDGRPKAF